MAYIRQLFFSKENIDRIQLKIKQIIFNKTNIKMTVNQNEQSLLIVMEKIYNNSSCVKHTDKPVHCVKLLNSSVIQHIIPEMLYNLKKYYKYNKNVQITTCMSKKGRNPLPSVTTLF